MVRGCLLGSCILPNSCSYLAMFSCNAMASRLACSGASITRLLTVAFGTPGIMAARSTKNSELVCEMMAKLEYTPCATSGATSICSWGPCGLFC